MDHRLECHEAMSISGSTIYLATHITDRLVALLGEITLINGSRTNIGTNIYENQPICNEHELPCITLIEGQETGLEREAGLVQTSIEYVIGAFVNRTTTTAANYTSDPSSERAIQGNMIADIREKLEATWCPLASYSASITYDGCRRLTHEEAGETTGIEMTYTIQFGAVDGDFCNTP